MVSLLGQARVSVGGAPIFAGRFHFYLQITHPWSPGIICSPLHIIALCFDGIWSL